MCYSNASLMKKKTIFLFLLFLMIYGAVNVDAQVRIGGESAPHPSAVLDLNSGDATVATGGLLLPQVRLRSVEDTSVFGVTLKEGLMVYNLNEAGDPFRPKKGIYCYDGERWLLISTQQVSNNPLITTDPKSLWLGRNGELTDTLTVTLSMNPGSSNLTYTWTAHSLDKVESIPLSSSTDKQILAVSNKFTSGKVYAVSCKVTIEGYGSEEKIIGYMVYGIGGWIGPGKWLNVASVNAGGDRTLSLEQQLETNIKERYRKSVVGGLFQWGRAMDGHEGDEDGNIPGKMSKVPYTDLDPETGSPGNGNFVMEYSGDWRTYPFDMGGRWFWRTMNNPTVGIDPCGIPDNNKWYVMTAEQWDSLKKHNDITSVDTDKTAGILVHPAGQMGPASFLIPHSGFRLMGSLSSIAYGSEIEIMISLWFNDSCSSTGQSTALTGEEYRCEERCRGLPIRCVSESF